MNQPLPPLNPATPTPTRCLFIGLAGAPNVGKSTLLNQLVGQKISIVSPKAQTTRNIIRGIATEGNTQCIYMDMPGIFKPKRNLEKYIVENAWSGIHDVDLVCFLVDAKRGLCPNTEIALQHLQQKGKKTVLVINKIDTVDTGQLLPLAKDFNDRMQFLATFMISARKKQGLKELVQFFCSHAPESPWMFPSGQHTDLPLYFLAAEITREQLFMQLQQELPYSTAVETEQVEENDKGELKIHQCIYVLKPNQKNMVIGHQGTRIKTIGAKARHELSYLLGKKVHLFLHVKLKEDWDKKPHLFSYPIL